jgi:hypothetical protein
MHGHAIAERVVRCSCTAIAPGKIRDDGLRFFFFFLFFDKVSGRSREVSQRRRVVYARRSKQSVSRCPRCSQGARSRKFDFVCEPFFQSVLSASWQFHHQRVNDEEGAEERERERERERGGRWEKRSRQAQRGKGRGRAG